MMNALPPWLLPFWLLGVPLLLAVVDVIRTPKSKLEGS